MELKINHDYMHNRVDIYLCEENGSGTDFISPDGTNLIVTRVSNFESDPKPIQPLLSMPPSLWRKMLPLFIVEANNNGIRNENENHLKGKLEATERHLCDLQKAFNKLLEK